MKIKILLFNGFDELDVVAPFEIFQTASQLGANLHASLVTLKETSEVLAAHGLRVKPEAVLAENDLDLLFVPGGGWIDHSPQGARAEVERGEIPRMIARMHKAGKLIAGVCTGVMLLAAAEILKGRAAVTHHGAIEDLKSCGAKWVHERVVDDGEIITAGGVTSGLDLALWLVERFAGASSAQAVEQVLEYHRYGRVWRGSSGV